jgi:hypothetical protein
MNRSLTFSLLASVLACGAFGCSAADRPGIETGGAGSYGSGGTASPSGSEVAVSVVSGALNNNSGTGVALYQPAPSPKASLVEKAFAMLNPVSTAYAATWTCTGDTLSPKFSGPAADPYAFTPASCSITWGSGKSGSSDWSSVFDLSYGSGCDDTHALMENQVGGCELTRTTPAGGNTRTITGPDGNSYAILHDTNGAGTGWDSSVSPAPNDSGVVITCGSGGCSAARSLVVNGSHLTGTVDIGGKSTKVWDHTVTASNISVTGAAGDRVASGTVTVQHNILKYTTTTTFTNVGYGEPLCCFPTSGSVSTTFSSGSNAGKTEKLSFSAACGEAELTDAAGQSFPITLQFCL